MVFNIPKFMEAEILYESQPNSTEFEPYLEVTPLRKDPDYAIYYNNWTRLVVLGIIPFAMLVYFNYKVCSLTYYLWSIGMFPFISFTHVIYVP